MSTNESKKRKRRYEQGMDVDESNDEEVEKKKTAEESTFNLSHKLSWEGRLVF